MVYKFIVFSIALFFSLLPQEGLGQFGGKNARQILVKVDGEWRPVVGAKEDRPVVLSEDGSIMVVKSPVYAAIKKELPQAGVVKVLQKLQRMESIHSERSGHMIISTNKDFEDLYVVFLYRYLRSDNEVLNVSVHEIGSIKANVPTKVNANIGFLKSGMVPTPVFYHKGFPLRTSNVKKE